MVGAALPSLPVPFVVVRSPVLPRWVGRATLVVLVSYSGHTYETLALAHAARERGCEPVCVTSGGQLADMAQDSSWPLVLVPGGLQPRAAMGYLLSAVAATLRAAGLGADLAEQVPEAAEVVATLTAEVGPRSGADNQARDLAERLTAHTALIYGVGPTVPAARRWKTQLNENAKVHAFWAEALEAGHNEVVPWQADARVSRGLYVVALTDPRGDPELHRRSQAVLASVAEGAVGVCTMAARGRSPLARACSAAHLGDWTSYYLALARGVDPTPVDAISELKARLATPQG